MFINVVQKAQPLFQSYPQVESYDQAKKLAKANPLFSWHAKYITRKRKKIVIFTNDASTLTVVIADVNAKKRSQLKDLFEEQLQAIWENMGLDVANLKAYLKAAGSWEISKSVNRSQIGHLTDVGVMLDYVFSQGNIDDRKMSIRMTRMVRNVSSGEVSFMDNLSDLMQPNNFKWQKVEIDESQIVDTKNLQEIRSQLEKLSASPFELTTDLSKVDKKVQEIQKLNNELIDAFINNVKDDYSEKTLKAYQNALKLYLNEFMAFRFETVFNDEASSVGELYSHGSSLTETKRVQRSMSRFYKFLADNEVVDAKFSKKMKHDLKADIDLLEEGFYGGYY